MYYKPEAGNLETVDAFMVVETTLYLFSDTVSTNHSVRLKGYKAVKDLSQDTSPLLVFRTPPAVFPTFSKVAMEFSGVSGRSLAEATLKKCHQECEQEVWTLTKRDGNVVPWTLR